MFINDRWSTYLSEGYPQIPWGVVAAGLAVSGSKQSGFSLEATSTGAVFVGIWFFLLLLKLIKDQQSREKDRLANPNKPLARGLLTTPEVLKGINYLTIGLIVYGALLAGGLHFVTGLLFIALALFGWLYSCDFFLQKLLARNPFFRICLRHTYAWLLVFFTVSAHTPEETFNATSWAFGSLLYCSLCLYELSHQLNPYAHPIQANALNFYGFKTVYIFASILIIIGLFFSITLNLEYLLFPFDLGLLIAFSILFIKHKLFYVTEILSTISLMVHSFAGTFF